jgi:group I intron endonuclease
MKKILIIGIYKITSPTDGVYIGQAIDIKDRWLDYASLHCENQRRLYHSLKKHGVKNHTFEIIHTLEAYNLSKSEIRIELNKLEIRYIKEFNSFVDDNKEHGLNLTRGGDVGEISEETRKLMSECRMGEKNQWYGVTGENHPLFGRKHSEEQNKNHSEMMKGVLKGRPSPFKDVPKSEEFKQKLRKPKKMRTEEHIKNNSDSNRGKKRNEASMINIINGQKKRRERELQSGFKAEKRIVSHETINKLSNATKLYWENVRQERALMIF